MYGAVLLPPHDPDADIAVLFMHNAGYSTMCGHGIIALTTGLIEERLYPATEPVTVIRYETPAGLVTADRGRRDRARTAGRRCASCASTNVPAYRHAANIVLDLPGVPRHGEAVARGGIRVDLAFGGAYYGIVDAVELGLRVVPEQIGRADPRRCRDHRRRCAATTRRPIPRSRTWASSTARSSWTPIPSTSPDGRGRGATMRNVTIFAEAEVDRSPCGSGTSALLAHLYAQGRLAIGQSIVERGHHG